MEANSWRLAQGEASATDAASGDWRTQLQPEARQRIVHKIMDTLKRCLPIVPEGLNELQKIAVQFEEKIYSTATSQADYLRKISLKMLSMETKTQHAPPSMLNPAAPNQNPIEPVPLRNQGQSLATPMVNLPAARPQLLPQNFQNNTSTAVQISANLPSALSSITGLCQSDMSSVCQTSNLQNMPGISSNSVSSSVGQGATPDIYAQTQRQMPGRQQQQQIISQQQQHSQNQLIYQHQLQQQLRKPKLQHSSLTQQQQSLLQPMQLQSSQQPVMQMSSGLQSGQSSIQQTQPMTMQSAAQPGLQQNQLNSVQQSVPSLLQQHPQSVARQQASPSMLQQTPSLQQQPTPVPQQSNLSFQQQQQQLMGQQTNISNMQQAQLLGQQTNVPDMQQQQQRLPVQQNNLLGMQQTQQILNQQSISLHQPQQVGHESNISGAQQQQQQQQQQLLGSLPNVSNMQVHPRSMHILQQPKTVAQQQQENQQTSLGLLQPQGQESQHQSTQQQIISQFQSQPAQLQQQLAMQQQSNSLQRQMQERLQASGSLLQSQNAEQQKQFVQAQRVRTEVSSTSVDSTAQTGHAGVVDLQEEIYQKIKSMREMYFADLNELYQKIASKLQQHDALIPPAKQSEQYGKVKRYKIMLEQTLKFLQISKNDIQLGLKEKLPLYEKQIINVLASNKKKTIPPQPQGQQQYQHPGGLAHSSQVSQLQQHDNHPNQVQHMNLQGSATSMQPAAVTGTQHVSKPLPTDFGVPTTQQNTTNALQPGSNLDSAQGGSFNSLQQGAIGSMLQGGGGSVPNTISAPQQTNANALSNSSMNTLQPNASLMQPSADTLQQQHLKQQRQEQQQQLMQTQQMKQQLQQHQKQQQQKQQLMQSQSSLQQQLHQQQKQPAQMLAHQVPQLHQTNEANESKVRPGIKPGLYQQHYSAGQHHGYHHQQLKPSASGASFPISVPQNPQVSSPQVDQHSLLPSQVKAGTPLQSASSPFVLSPSTPCAPSPIPADAEKQLSGIPSLANAGHVEHQQSALAPPQALDVGISGISASHILAENTSPDGNQANLLAPDKKSASEWPLERLIKVVKSSSPKALSSAISDIGSVVSMFDRIAGSAPGNGSRAAVGEDLVAMTKCRLQARNFMSQDGNATVKKMKRNTSCMPLNNMSSAGSVNDSVKKSYGLDTSELESTATSCVKRQKIGVNHALLEEIREINQQLIGTIVNIIEEDADSVAAASNGEGTVIKCSFTAVALSPSFKSQFASSHMSPILPLRLLVPANYPKCSPVLLDKLPDESSGESDDLLVKAKSRFSISLRGLSQPMSLREMARSWDACARKVIVEYAQQTGGGSFSSRYGAWENCVGA